MAKRNKSPFETLSSSPAVREAAAALIDAVAEEWRSRGLEAKSYDRALKEIERRRGRPPMFPMLLPFALRSPSQKAFTRRRVRGG